MTYRPKIGLTMRLELETRRFYLGRDYSEALEAAGGLPVHIPLIPKREYIAAIVEGLDGILLPGCDSDVDPAYYGEDPHPKLGRVVPEKDETDLMVLEEAERLNLPVLAICFGCQVLNVSRGGSLIQDILSQVPNAIKHSQDKPVERNSHAIAIEGDSILEELAGKGTVLTKVNSHHHQAIKQPGHDLRMTAKANDGVIEFIEDTRPGRFVIGVQWHPELSYLTDRLSKIMFETFVAKCVKKAKIA
jgi:putative glutamine amidotransferase